MTVYSFQMYQRRAERLKLLEKLFEVSLAWNFSMQQPEYPLKHQAVADLMLAVKALKDFDTKNPVPA